MVTPSQLSGSNVKIQVQHWAGKWITVKTASRTIAADGKYTWRVKPANRGSYRVRAAIAATATHTGARTAWDAFKVR